MYNIKNQGSFIELLKGAKPFKRFYCPVLVLPNYSKCGTLLSFTICDGKGECKISVDEIQYLEDVPWTGTHEDYLRAIDDMVAICNNGGTDPEVIETTGAGLSTQIMCKDGERRVIRWCKVTLADGTETVEIKDGTLTLTDAQLESDYSVDCPDPYAGCMCVPFVYEVTDGTEIDNAALIAALNSTTVFPDGSTGGITGINQIQIGLEGIGSYASDNSQSTTSQVTKWILNGQSTGWNSGEVQSFGDHEKYEPVTSFCIQALPNSILQFSGSVYKCP